MFQRCIFFSFGAIGWLLKSIRKGTAHHFRALQSWN